MSFSITGSLLSGTFLRPDFITFTRSQNNKIGKDTIPCSTLNKLGYDFKTSIFSGAFRASLGLIHTIAHSVIALFAGLIRVLFRHDNLKKIANHHFSEAGLGLKNFGRGLIEIIPIFGSLIMRKIDEIRIAKFEEMAIADTNTNCTRPDLYEQDNEYARMFYCGERIGTARHVFRLKEVSIVLALRNHTEHFFEYGVHVRFLEKAILNDKKANCHIKSKTLATKLFAEELK